MSTVKKISVAVIALFLCCVIGFVAVNLFKTNESMFMANSDTYTLTQEYVLSDDDVKATNSSGKVVLLNKPVTMDLGGYALDLNGYTLKIASETEGALVKVKNGTVKNGVLDIAVPNGDIEFDTAVIANTVDYELEAASQTIRFSNVTSSGKGTVKSDTHIQISYSEMADISLAGNGSLEAGEGTKLGKLSVAQSAAGAKVVISPTAKVTSLAISAKAEVNIAGSVEDVEVKAVAKVAVTGEVKKVSVAAEAASATESAEISIAPTATVDNVDLKAKTTLDVQGVVANVVVGATATGTTVSITGDHAVAGRVVVSAEDTVLEADEGTVSKVLVSSDVAEKVEISSTVEKEVVEDVTELEKVHNYVLTDSVEATCTTPGTKTYTCSEEGCEDGYTITVPTRPHTIEEEIVQLPSQIAVGIKSHTCSVCGYHYETKIPALELEADSLYQLICLILGDQDMTLKVSDGAKISVYKECLDYSFEEGFRADVELAIANAAISIKNGEPTGFLSFEVNTTYSIFDGEGEIKTFVDEDALENTFAFDLYINEGVVYIENNSYGLEQSGTLGLELLDQILAQSTNGSITVDKIFTAIEVYNFSETAFENYVPFVEAVQKAINNKEDVNLGELFVTFFDEYLISEEVLEDNAGTLYSLDVNGLSAITDTFATKTLAEVIEEKCGEGKVDELAEKIKGLPTLTVKEIADAAIAIAEEYKFDVDYTFSLIETYVFMLSGVEIDIQAELEANYELTLIDIIMSMTGTAGPSGGVVSPEGPEFGDDTKVDVNFDDVKLQSESKEEIGIGGASGSAPTGPIPGVNEDEIGGGEGPQAPTKEEMITMFETMVDGYVEQIKTLTIDQLYNVLVYGDSEYKPEGSDEAFALSTMLKGTLGMVSEMATLDVLVDVEGNLVAISAMLANGIEAIYNVEDGVYTVVAYFSLYEIKVEYTPETKAGLATLSVYNEETALYEAVYTAKLTHNGEEDYKYLFEIEELLKAGLNYATDENGNLAFDGILSVLGYTVQAEVDEATQTGTVKVLMGENTLAEFVLEDTETGKQATVLAMGYKLVLDYVSEDSVVEAVAYKYDPSTYEFVEMISLGMAFEGEDFDFKAVLEMADQVFAEVVASWDITDLATIINGTVTTAMGYNLTVDANSEDKTASVILTMGEGVGAIEMGKVTVEEDEEGYTLVKLYYAMNQVATISHKGVETNDFNTKLEVVIGDNAVTVEVLVETLEDGKYLIAFETITEAEGMEIGQYMQYIIGFETVDNVETISVEPFVRMTGDMFGDGTDVVDGTVIFNVTKDENGKTQKVDVDVDVDKFLVMMDSDTTEGFILNTVSTYAELDFEVSFDFTTSEEIPEDITEGVVEMVNILDGVKIDYEDGVTVFDALIELEVRNAENGKYIALKEKMYNTEYVSLIPIVNGCLPNGTIAVTEACQNWYNINFMALTQAQVVEYDYEGNVVSDEDNYVTRQVSVYILYNVETGEVRRMEENVHDYNVEIEKFGETCNDGYKAKYSCKNCDEKHEYIYEECQFEGSYEVIGETLCSENTSTKIEVYNAECICCGKEQGHYSYPGCSMNWADIDHVVTLEKAIELGIEGFEVSDFIQGSVYKYVCHWCGLEEYQYSLYCHNQASNQCYTVRHNVLKYEGQLNEVTGNMDYAPFEYSISYTHDTCMSKSTNIDTVYYDDDEELTQDDAKYLSYLRLVFGEDLVKVEDLWLGSVTLWGCEHCGELNHASLTATTAYKISAYNYKNYNFDFTLYYEDGVFSYANIESYQNSASEWDLRIFKKIIAPYVTELEEDYNFEERIVGLEPNGSIYADGTMELSIVFTMKAQYVDDYQGNEHTLSDKVEFYINTANKKEHENYGAKVGYYDVHDCEVEWYIYDKQGDFLGVNYTERHNHTVDVYTGSCSCSEEGRKVNVNCLICGEELYNYTSYSHGGGYNVEANLNTYWTNTETQGFTSVALNASGRYNGWYCVDCDKFTDLQITLYEDWTLNRDVYLYAENIVLDLNNHVIDLNGYNLIIYGIDGSEVILTNKGGAPDAAINDSVGTGTLVLFSFYGNVDITFGNLDSEFFVTDTDDRETIQESFRQIYGKELEGFVDWAN